MSWVVFSFCLCQFTIALKFVDEYYLLNVAKNHRLMSLKLFIKVVINLKINKQYVFCHHYKYNRVPIKGNI
jgi:hypothetical protein